MLWSHKKRKRGLLRAKVAKQGKASRFDGPIARKNRCTFSADETLDLTIRGGAADPVKGLRLV